MNFGIGWGVVRMWVLPVDDWERASPACGNQSGQFVLDGRSDEISVEIGHAFMGIEHVVGGVWGAGGVSWGLARYLYTQWM